LRFGESGTGDDETAVGTLPDDRERGAGRVTRVGVAGSDAADVVAALDIDGVRVEADDPPSLVGAGVDVLVALGADALFDLVAAGAEQPVLPVDAGAAVGSIPRAALAASVGAVGDGTFECVDARLLSVAADGTTYRALADVMAVTAEPARISEYGIHTTVEGAARTVDTVRADGIVVATPRGSHGYARDARGATLAPDADTVSVVPIAPFRIDRAHWGLRPPVTLTVERDDSAVTLIVDGVDRGELDAGASIELTWGERLPLVRVAWSRGPFE
jgi:NAD+ kinase